MVKIAALEVENVKRVQAVYLEPAPSGLTVIGGRNKAGKTTILDAILWGLGGNKFRPSEPKRRDASADPSIRIELDNGLVVTRSGKNSSLKVASPTGLKAGQSLIDEFLHPLAINLPSFLHATPKQKAETLLQVIGVGEQLTALDQEIEKVYNERYLVGLVRSRKKSHAQDLPFEQGVPEEEISASKLIQQQQEILVRNGENQRLRARRAELAEEVERAANDVMMLAAKLEEAKERYADASEGYSIASRSVADLEDESTAELEASLRQIDDINRRVRTNKMKWQAEAEASDLEAQVQDLTAKLESVRASRLDLLAGAQLPLPGLSIEGSELTYQGAKWDCMSAADQLRVGVAIARQLQPTCGFVLLDKLEQMDLQTLAEFGEWLEGEGLQAIATRVSTGEECSIIIEDGLVTGAPLPVPDAIVEEVVDDDGVF